MSTLTERQIDILKGVIKSHIETSGPVGSQYMARRYALPMSSATIRNEMGALEEMGYLTHPHTSSGRVPTDSGYRYYLDHSAFEEMLPEPFYSQVASELNERYSPDRTIEAFLDKVSFMLSSMTQEIGLSLSSIAPEGDLERKIDELRLSLQGLTHLLEKPEFHDINKLRGLLKMLEEKILVKQWLLRKSREAKIAVSVGHENENEALEDCSIVTARYSAGEYGTGVIAVLGPKRMPYWQVIPLVSQVAGMMNAIFANEEGTQ